MAPKYTLYYHKLHARGEPIRMLFHYAEQRFEEVNWEARDFEMKWKDSAYLVCFSLHNPASASEVPFGRVPMLEVQLDNGDCWRIAETTAILRYLSGVLGTL